MLGEEVAAIGGPALTGPAAARAWAAEEALLHLSWGVLSGCHCCKSYSLFVSRRLRKMCDMTVI